MLAHAKITNLLPLSLKVCVFSRNVCLKSSFSVFKKNSDFGRPNSLVPFLPYVPKCPNFANPCLLKIRTSFMDDP